MKEFRVRTGSIIGSEHQRLQINNQDGYVIGEMEHNSKKYLWGIICDGCSAGLHNEIGAILLSNYLCSEIPYLISSGLAAMEIPNQLFIAGLGYLRSLAAHTAMGGSQQRLQFVKNHLLCTVIGFIMDGDECVFFAAGDGVIIKNDVVIKIDQENKPIYMGYHLVDKAFLKDLRQPLPLKFATWAWPINQFWKWAVCSDGFKEEILDEIWGHQHIAGLQRKLRVSRLQKKAIFSDDCTIIAVEKEVNQT